MIKTQNYLGNYQDNYDFFIRTTDTNIKKLRNKYSKKVYNKGNIYLSNYTGWYNSREERFVRHLSSFENKH